MAHGAAEAGEVAFHFAPSVGHPVFDGRLEEAFRLQRVRIDLPDAAAFLGVAEILREKAFVVDVDVGALHKARDAAAAREFPPPVPVAGLVDGPFVVLPTGVVDLAEAVCIVFVVVDDDAFLQVEADADAHVDHAALRARRRIDDEAGRFERDRQVDGRCRSWACPARPMPYGNIRQGR